MIRISTVSTQPRVAPAISPTAVPISTPDSVTAKAPRKLWRAPWRMRTAMSLPSSSVPNRKPSPGRRERRADRDRRARRDQSGPMKAISSKRTNAPIARLVAAPEAAEAGGGTPAACAPPRSRSRGLPHARPTSLPPLTWMQAARRSPRASTRCSSWSWLGANRERRRASRVIRAAARRVERARQLALRLRRLAAEVGNGGEQRPRVRVSGFARHLLGGPDLDDPAEVHDGDPVGDEPGDGEVVGDEDDRDPEVLAQLADQVEHGRGQRDVERAGRLVAEQHRRRDDDRAGDRRPLLLAARELPRAILGDLGRQARPGPAPPSSARGFGGSSAPVAAQPLGDLVADAHPRRQRGGRRPGRPSAAARRRRSRRARRPASPARRPPAAGSTCRNRSRRPARCTPRSRPRDRSRAGRGCAPCGRRRAA